MAGNGSEEKMRKVSLFVIKVNSKTFENLATRSAELCGVGSIITDAAFAERQRRFAP